MKRYIHCETTTEADGEYLAIETFGTSNPGPGCSFISPDGTFVNIYPKLTIHEDLCDWVEEQINIELPYKDEEYFVREFGWIRLRSDPDMSIIELPNEYPFAKQWYSLQDWLEFIEERKSEQEVAIHLCDTDIDGYLMLGHNLFAEDILKACKRCYASGKLVASKELS